VTLSTTSGHRSRSLLRLERARIRTSAFGAAPAMTAKHTAMGTTFVTASTSRNVSANSTTDPATTFPGVIEA
jgi:hypothetical protein